MQIFGPLVLYRSPECWGYAELEQTSKYKSTQCSISCHPYRSIRNKFDPVIKIVKVNPGSSFEKKAPGNGHTTTWYKFWQHFKAFIIPIILCQFQKDPFCLISLYDRLFYFVHVYKAPGQEETTLGDNFFLCKQKGLITLITGCMFKIALPSDFMHIFSWFYTCT